MLTTVLRDCGADPSYVIGGILNATGLGAEDGAGMDFVAEADESDGSFLLLSPDVAIVTNVEADHLDNYGSLAEIADAFTAFGSRVSSLVLTCADDPGADALAARLQALEPARVRRYGESPGADYRLGDVKSQGLAVSFAVTADHSPFGEIFTQLTVQVPGRHNALNATAAFAAAVELGFAPRGSCAALAAYRGARRRMESRARRAGCGSSIATRITQPSWPPTCAPRGTSLRRARGGSSPSSSRTCTAGRGSSPQSSARRSGLADEVLVLDVYAAREDPEPGVTGAARGGRGPRGAGPFPAGPGPGRARDLPYRRTRRCGADHGGRGRHRARTTAGRGPAEAAGVSGSGGPPRSGCGTTTRAREPAGPARGPRRRTRRVPCRPVPAGRAPPVTRRRPASPPAGLARGRPRPPWPWSAWPAALAGRCSARGCSRSEPWWSRARIWSRIRSPRGGGHPARHAADPGEHRPGRGAARCASGRWRRRPGLGRPGGTG